MNLARCRWLHCVLSTISIAIGMPASRAVAQSVTAPFSVNAVTISGTITDARNLPIVGAVITARGTAIGWTATRHDGSYVMTVPAGSYDILVRKGGYAPGMTSIVLGGGASKVLSLTLAEANLRSIGLGGGDGAGVPFNAGVGATATLGRAAISQRPSAILREVVLELPGLTLAHGADSSPDTSFVARGGGAETRVQIDGHPVSAGATGRPISSYASLPLIDNIEVVKGPAMGGANAGESLFGTMNLRTRDFAPGRTGEFIVGGDTVNGVYATVGLTGNFFKDDRLSYVLEHHQYRDDGPARGQVAYRAIAAANGTAVIVGLTSLAAPRILGSDLFKLRWRFSAATSLDVGYVGLHSDYEQTGGAYAARLGPRTIVVSAPTGLGGAVSTAPQFADLIGTTVPAYALADNATAQINAPLFEAEFRTALGNDTLLVRPYAGTIYHVVDGWNADNGDPTLGAAFSVFGALFGCSGPALCAAAASATSVPFRNEENDRLGGVTATYAHPMGESLLSLSFDQRSDRTRVSSGNPSIRYNGTPESLVGYADSIPETVATNADWSATYAVPLTNRLRLFAGMYDTSWKLDYTAIALVPDLATGSIGEVTTLGRRRAHHDDPQVGITWHPQSATSYRLSVGSAITVPYAELVSGQITARGIFRGGQVGFKNASLAPETTFGYNLGIDRRLRNGAVISADVFENAIHNAFATRVAPFDSTIFGIPADSPYHDLFATTSMPVNAPLERHYGLEASLLHAPSSGLGYRIAATLQRAFLDRLPRSLASPGGGLADNQQLAGSTAVPYTQAFGELNYRRPSGFGTALSVDYTGTNNWTNGPAFTVWAAMLRYDRRGYRAQLSVENLFGAVTGDSASAGTAGAGFALLGATPTTRFGIAPRTFRFQLEAHLGH